MHSQAKRPHYPPYGFLKIGGYDFSDGSVFSGFSVGYPLVASLYDGTPHLDYKDTRTLNSHKTVLQNSAIFYSPTELLYEQLLSSGSRDEMFSPAKDSLSYSGLLAQGMSGGALLFGGKEKGVNIIGIISGVTSSSFYNELDHLRNVASHKSWKKSEKLVQKYFEKISKNTPIYNIWTPIGTDEKKWIEQYMEKTSH